MAGPQVMVSRDFHFDAAHKLPNYNGQCEKLHGHRWHLRVSVKAAVNEESGIAVDFLEIDRVVGEKALADLDHAYLNDILVHPSAENLAVMLWGRLEGELPLFEIEVWETPRNKVLYRPGL